MRFHKRSILAYLAAICPFALYAEGGGGGGGGGNGGGGGGGNSDQLTFTQADIDKALQANAADFAKKLKEMTGHESLDAWHQANLAAKGETEKLLGLANDKANKYEGLWKTSVIERALMGASGEALDPEVMIALLSPKAQVAEDGKVTIDGKDAATAVAELLKAKPHLAKAGQPGGGTPPNGGGNQKVMARAEFDKLPAAERSKFMREGGKVT